VEQDGDCPPVENQAARRMFLKSIHCANQLQTAAQASRIAQMTNYFSSTASQDSGELPQDGLEYDASRPEHQALPHRPIEAGPTVEGVNNKGPTRESKAAVYRAPTPSVGVPPHLLTYSQEKAIEQLTSLYEFVALVHRDGERDNETEWALVHPPREGWAGDWNSRVANGEYTNEAVQLIQHLPRFRSPQYGTKSEGPSPMADTVFSSRFTGHRKGVIDKADDIDNGYYVPPGTCNLPPHMVRLTECGNRYGYDVIVDTQTGCVLWQKFFDGFAPYIDWETKWLYRMDESETNEKLLGSYSAMSIESFVDTVKECYNNMWWIPELEGEDWEVHECKSSTDFDESELRRQRVMMNAGWPDPGWDKRRAAGETNALYEAGEISL
jgi:hypothetical protein